MSCRKKWRMFHVVKGSVVLSGVKPFGPSLEIMRTLNIPSACFTVTWNGGCGEFGRGVSIDLDVTHRATYSQ